DWGCMEFSFKSTTAVEIRLDLSTTWRGFSRRFRFRLMMVSIWEARLTSGRSTSAAQGSRQHHSTKGTVGFSPLQGNQISLRIINGAGWALRQNSIHERRNA